MELSGNIYWIYPPIDTYDVSKKDLKPTDRGTITSCSIDQNHIKFTCTYKGDLYSAELNSEDGIKYSGKIFWEGELGGQTFLRLYKNDWGYSLIGDWLEDGYPSSTCISEIKAVEAT